MAFGDKLKEIFGDNSEEEKNYTPEDEFYAADNDKGEVNTGNKMILLEPRAYSESQQIADHLKKRNTIVVNLKRVTPEQAKRIVDFLTGTLYAIGGNMQKLGNGIFLCTPKNIGVEGKMSIDDKQVKSKKEPDDYEW